MKKKLEITIRNLLKRFHNNQEEISWFLTGILIMMLATLVDPWFISLVIYGLFLRAIGYTPKYFFFGAETKKLPVGKVFDAHTQKPLSLAVVRLYNQRTKRLVQTKVTNNDGIFDFLLPEGHYVVEVVKQGYQFPSKSLNKGYTGEIITVGKEVKYTYFHRNIYLDPAKIINNNLQTVPVKATNPKLPQTVYN